MQNSHHEATLSFSKYKPGSPAMCIPPLFPSSLYRSHLSISPNSHGGPGLIFTGIVLAEREITFIEHLSEGWTGVPGGPIPIAFNSGTANTLTHTHTHKQHKGWAQTIPALTGHTYKHTPLHARALPPIHLPSAAPSLPFPLSLSLSSCPRYWGVVIDSSGLSPVESH